MQLVEERDEVLARHRPYRADIATAEFVARAGIDEDLVVIQHVTLAGGGIDLRQHEERQRLAGFFGRQREVDDAAGRIARLEHRGDVGGG